jgi:tetratricopeptide (TPR) repeat protein
MGFKSTLRLALVAIGMLTTADSDFAQQQNGRSVFAATLMVAVIDADSRPIRARVRLEGIDVRQVWEQQTDDRGQTVFFFVPPGMYRLISSTSEYLDRMQQIEVSGRESFRSETIRLSPHRTGAGTTVSLSELQLSKASRQAYEKGVMLLKRARWAEARTLFLSIIAEAPNYARAYNGLGIALSELDEVHTGIQAFEQAINLDRHFDEAYLNLSRLYWKADELSESESVLRKLLSVNPNNTKVLSQLVTTQLKEGKPNDAIVTVDDVHASGRPHDPILHLYAAEAYSSERTADDEYVRLQFHLYRTEQLVRASFKPDR